VVDVCRQFLHDLQELCPKNAQSRLSASHIEEAVKSRCEAVSKELEQIMDDLREHPINYNHHYTDTVNKCRVKRDSQSIIACVQVAAINEPVLGCQSDHTSIRTDYGRPYKECSQSQNPDMDISSCEAALDGLIAILIISSLQRLCEVAPLASVKPRKKEW
jgi:hypothetical protein